MRPYDAKGIEQACSLQGDSHDVGGYWILTDGFQIFIHQQALGEGSKQRIDIPRATFNRMVDWYLREQKLRKAA